MNSSLTFKTEAERLCKVALASSANIKSFHFEDVDIENAVTNYWKTVSKSYKDQLSASRRDAHAVAKARDRRKMRQKRVSTTLAASLDLY